MAYVPPGRRQGASGGGSAPPPAPSSGRDRGYGSGGGGDSFRYGGVRGDRDGYSRGGGGGGWGGSGGGGGSGFPRSASSNGLGSRSSSSTNLQADGRGSQGPAAVETRFPDWKPSERIQAMTKAQIQEARDRLNVTVENDSNSSNDIAPIESFDDMNLDPGVLRDIRAHGYERPTPIQCQGIPVSLTCRDILGCAETGSGKTASFAIPMVQHVLHQDPLRRGDGPLALVLAPTRELAQQIEVETQKFSTSSRNKCKTAIIVGGNSISDQRSVLRSGVEIVVATPGRLIDHLQQNNTNLSRVGMIVLDEADRMLDLGFQPQIEEILRNIPGKRQTLLFSATMPEEIEKLARTYLRDPFRVKVGQVSTPTANVSQALQRTTETEKIPDCLALLAEEAREAQQAAYKLPLTVVFVERKKRCDEVADALNEIGIRAVALHGDLGQGQREQSLREFTDGTAQVLVATDVASRGLDIKGIGHVINLDLPKSFEDYVHRIGRTGRAGSTGRATSFFTERDMFIVSKIKNALSELEKGNAFAFATGKAARAAEKELAQQFKEKAKLANSGIVSMGSAAVKVDDKYKFMASAMTSASAGKADDAWDD